MAGEKLHCIVMEYVDGGTLEKYSRAGALLLGVTYRYLNPANPLPTSATI